MCSSSNKTERLRFERVLVMGTGRQCSACRDREREWNNQLNAQRGIRSYINDCPVTPSSSSSSSFSSPLCLTPLENYYFLPPPPTPSPSLSLSLTKQKTTTQHPAHKHAACRVVELRGVPLLLSVWKYDVDSSTQRPGRRGTSSCYARLVDRGGGGGGESN